MAFQALDRFQQQEGRLPQAYSKDDAGKLITIAKDVNSNAQTKVEKEVHPQSLVLTFDLTNP